MLLPSIAGMGIAKKSEDVTAVKAVPHRAFLHALLTHAFHCKRYRGVFHICDLMRVLLPR